MQVNDYQKEQLEALRQVSDGLARLTRAGLNNLHRQLAGYINFRQRVDQFQQTYFSKQCARSCFDNQLSACCSKDGIITFWADVVINACYCTPQDLLDWRSAIVNPMDSGKCIYLTPAGCCWRVRPLVCAMFLCEAVQVKSLKDDIDAARQWQALQQEAKGFRWPDGPVLFDQLEQRFMELGCDSTLMFLNKSPGLLRIKKKAAASRRHPESLPSRNRT